MRRYLLLNLSPWLCLWASGLQSGAVAAATPPTTTVKVPMRDGTLLATDVYLPAGNGPWPVALARTPYNRIVFRSANGGHGGIPISSFLNNGMALVAQDQRKVEGRPDVLLFTTPSLTTPLEATGRITVHLNATTSAKDTDFTAKLTDVYPDGRSILLTDGIVRVRFRHTLEKDELITPGQAYAYDIDLGSTSIVFNKGRQIRVIISSSNSPRFEPNPNTGGSLPPDPKEKPVVAHQTIFLGGPEGSYISLPQMVSGA